jgi:dipeptidyl-peptidase-2
LFYPGNEAPIEEFYQMTGFIFELAQYTNALVIFAEHRYYGDSLPFGKDSFTPENIKYLTSEQAMADFAILVKWLKNKEGLKKAVVIGGSYGGMLAAWLRLKYPNVFVGALAASAPIYLATGVDIPSGAFYQKVTESFMKADPTCPGLVQSAFVQLNTLADKELFDDITKSFKLCKPITQEKINDLIGWVRTSFCTLAMENFPYPAPPFPANPVLKACQILTSSSDLLGGLADAAGLAYNGSGNLPCYNLDDEYVECADASGCGAGPASVSWDYQSCSEFKFLITTNNQTDMFPPYSLDHSEYCHSQWDLPYTWRGDWVGLSFWINDMSAASNIIFSNGDLDPWSVGGVQ